MAYKRYFYRKGKKFGPYYYESYRDETGKVRKRYVGTIEPGKEIKEEIKDFKKSNYSYRKFLVIGFFSLIILFGFFIFVYSQNNNFSRTNSIFSIMKESAISPVAKLIGLTIDEVEEKSEPAGELLSEGDVGGTEETIEDDSTPEEETYEGQLTLVPQLQEETPAQEEIPEIIEAANETLDIFYGENITEQENVIEVQENETESNIAEINETEFMILEREIKIIPENFTEFNETGINITEINLTDANITEFNETNISEINLTQINGTVELNITTIQHKAVIGEPVKWVKTITVNKTLAEAENIELKVDIPKDAENITIKIGKEAIEAKKVAKESTKEQEKENVEIRKSRLTGEVVKESENRGLLTWLWEFLTGFSITGKVIDESELKDQIREKENKKEIDIESVVEWEKEEELIAIEYETPAPVADEEVNPRGKKVTVSADDELNYTDILAYTQLDNRVALIDSDKIRVYWVKQETIELKVEENITAEENGTNVTQTIVNIVVNNFSLREEVNFTAFDLDLDGNIDYIEWNVEHLSEQVYEIIYITKAEHYYSNYTFIEDVYDSVKERDGNYTSIPDSHILRVTFERELDNSKDITIYARAGCNGSVIINGTEVPCEIIEKKKRIDEIKRGIIEE